MVITLFIPGGGGDSGPPNKYEPKFVKCTIIISTSLNIVSEINLKGIIL